MTPTLPVDPLWMMEPGRMADMLAMMRGMDLSAIQSRGSLAASVTPAYTKVGNVATISIEGTLSKHVTIWQWIFGGTSYMNLAASIDAALADSAIDTIVLVCDSPGGSSHGCADVADAVYRARGSKRVVSFVSDLCASAAYEICSQAHEVVANESALVGSIGTYTVVYDWSQAFEKQGVRAHVIRAGSHKAAGILGEELSEERLAEIQRLINGINALFIKAVSRGRGLAPDFIRGLEGKIFLGGEAKRLGLVDRIMPMGDLIGSLLKRPAAVPLDPRKVAAMEHATKVVASVNRVIDATRPMYGASTESKIAWLWRGEIYDAMTACRKAGVAPPKELVKFSEAQRSVAV